MCGEGRGGRRGEGRGGGLAERGEGRGEGGGRRGEGLYVVCSYGLVYVVFLLGSRFIAILLPSSPGAPFDLSNNHYLSSLLTSFGREKSMCVQVCSVTYLLSYYVIYLYYSIEPICAIGLGVCGLFSTLDRQSQKWTFAEYSMTGVSACIGKPPPLTSSSSFP